MKNTKVDVEEVNNFQFSSVRVFSDEFEKAHLKNVSRTVTQNFSIQNFFHAVTEISLEMTR